MRCCISSGIPGPVSLTRMTPFFCPINGCCPADHDRSTFFLSVQIHRLDGVGERFMTMCWAFRCPPTRKRHRHPPCHKRYACFSACDFTMDSHQKDVIRLTFEIICCLGHERKKLGYCFCSTCLSRCHIECTLLHQSAISSEDLPLRGWSYFHPQEVQLYPYAREGIPDPARKAETYLTQGGQPVHPAYLFWTSFPFQLIGHLIETVVSSWNS